ncbi:thiolase family protein [Vulgatibacter sp.]|uniref:thiolase family protein n=1 Tax=Vulgatibacter sp. TaxID=1971226 RepID=UPI0035640AD2
MREALICAAVRTPIGKLRGALQSVRPDDLAAHAIGSLLRRAGVDGARVDEVILGCANQAGEDNRNVARMALLLAGMPQSVPGVTVNRLCASGLEAAIQAARMIAVGEAEVVVAGGVESMTRAPWAMPKPDGAFPTGGSQVFDTSLGWRFPNPKMEALFPLEQMGETAENVAEKYGIGREEQDRFAFDSHRKAVAAWERGAFRDEVIPVEIPQRKGPALVVDRDECPRPDTTPEKLATLQASFRKGGSVTAGNSSSLNDGAAALLLASPEAAKELGLTPIARFVGGASAGVDPRYMGIGPVPAVRKLLVRHGVAAADVDLVELNEAFAVQSIACVRDLGFDPDRVNVNGGAIALGHPLGCSGARILTTLVHEMKRRGARRGVASMCVGVGQGVAALVERV